MNKEHTDMKDARVDNIRRSTRQTRKANWHETYKGPFQYRRVMDVPDAVKERLPGEAMEDYRERRRSTNHLRSMLMAKGFRNYTPRILRERDGRLVNISRGTFRKRDYE
jgi:hypothetical protein